MYLPEKDALALLADAAAACMKFSAENVLPGGFRLDLLYRIGDGGFLVLSDAIAEKAGIRDGEPGHPLLSGERATSFALGCAAYRIMTGRPAFQDHRDMEIPPLPLRAVRPEIREDAALFVEKAVAPARGAPSPSPPALAEWAVRLRNWAHEGFTRPLAVVEIGRFARKGRSRRRNRALKVRFRGYLRRNGGLLAAASAALTVVLLFGIPVLRGLLARPVSAGLAPEAVVRLFYSSMGKLDHAAMRDCVTGNAGRDYIETAAHLYAVSRVRQAVEGAAIILGADEWERSGRPAGAAVYGAARLLAEEAPEDSPELPVFLVRFELRLPSPDSAAGSEGFLVTDKVYIGSARKGWRITRIERIDEKRISPPALP